MTAAGREFQVAGAAQLKDHLPMSASLNGTMFAFNMVKITQHFYLSRFMFSIYIIRLTNT